MGFKKKIRSGSGFYKKNPKPGPDITQLPWNYKKLPIYIAITNPNSLIFLSSSLCLPQSLLTLTPSFQLTQLHLASSPSLLHKSTQPHSLSVIASRTQPHKSTQPFAAATLFLRYTLSFFDNWLTVWILWAIVTTVRFLNSWLMISLH